jgi:hypothetical protein
MFTNRYICAVVKQAQRFNEIGDLDKFKDNFIYLTVRMDRFVDI